MTRELLLADKIMKEANDVTGCRFWIGSYKEGYVVESKSSKNGMILDVRIEVQESEVTIYTIFSGCGFDEEKVKRELDLMGSTIKTIKAIEISDEVVKLECKMSFIYARRNTRHMIVWMMLPMVVKMSNLIKNKTAA